MVFLDSFSMSSTKARQGPFPPSVEQILEDLSVASDNDVVFKSSILAEHSSQSSKGKTNNGASYSGKGENSLEHSVSEKDTSDNKGNADESNTKGQSSEQLYGVVASFLKEFKSLESSQECLGSLDQDLKSKKECLEEAINKVEEAWKVEKNDS